MGVTNYFAVDSVIFGEETVGSPGTRAYGLDALGSIAATYDAAEGLIEDTYYYTPCGSLSFQTGGAISPLFLWNGGLAFRQTYASHSDIYAIGSSYDTSAGRWSNIGTLSRASTNGFRFSQPAAPDGNCTLPAGSPVSDDVLKTAMAGVCGAFSGDTINWVRDDLPQRAYGFIVQEIDQKPGKGTPCCSSKTVSCPPETLHYWEAWWWNYGTLYDASFTNLNNAPYDDLWNRPGVNCLGLIGGYGIEAYAKFVQLPISCAKTNGWKPRIDLWGNLFGTFSQPPGWNRQNIFYRMVTPSYGCCMGVPVGDPCQGLSCVPISLPYATGGIING
jgi:hypothetical protein